ncbi:uncharacterized protein LOC105632256 [Jatropha curcas]|uniref:uncharacterized protein LOC105632256 n=1 Tax=Jatropha curcas TaxID=180498 RepID=UPI0005FBEEA3|nr:uncharacterized protein LOC105632256 [Jatropha curcas]
MVTLSNKSLMYFEDLTLPTFQVIVMSGSMGCARCRERVSRVISKIAGLREYTVDLHKKQVIVKGDFRNEKKEEDDDVHFSSEMKESCYSLKLFFRSFVTTCFRKTYGCL